MNTTYLGLDVSKNKIDCALAIGGGYRTKVIDNSFDGFKSLDNWLLEHKINNIHACCEATNIYWEPVANHLYESNKQVSVVNPLQIRTYGKMIMQRGKTDIQDAKLIAQYCENQQPDLWHVPKGYNSVLIALTRNLQYLKVTRASEMNRLKVAHHVVRDQIETIIRFLTEQIKDAELQIKNHISKHKELAEKAKLLDSIPAIGKSTIPFLLSLFIDTNRFEAGK